MWWYKNQQQQASEAAVEEESQPGGPLAMALSQVVEERHEDDLLLLMALLVDSRFEFDDAEAVDGPSWGVAEQMLHDARGELVRLYNRFARDIGDGYTYRDDLPPEEAKVIEQFRTALAAAEGIVSIGRRTPDAD